MRTYKTSTSLPHAILDSVNSLYLVQPFNYSLRKPRTLRETFEVFVETVFRNKDNRAELFSNQIIFSCNDFRLIITKKDGMYFAELYTTDMGEIFGWE